MHLRRIIGPSLEYTVRCRSHAGNAARRLQEAACVEFRQARRVTHLAICNVPSRVMHACKAEAACRIITLLGYLEPCLKYRPRLTA